MSGILSHVARVEPLGALETHRDKRLSPQAAYVLTRVDAPCDPEALAAATGLPVHTLAQLLDELSEAGCVRLVASTAPVAAPPARPTPAAAASSAATPPTAPASTTAPIRRIQPHGDLLSLRDVKLSAQAGYVLSRLDGPMSPEELAAVTGLGQAELRPILDELQQRGAADVLREEAPAAPAEAPAAPSATRAAAPARGQRRGPALAPVAAAFGGDPFADTEPLDGALWLERLYHACSERESLTFVLGYAGDQVWALRVEEGFLSGYRTNRTEESWRVGSLLRQLAGLEREDVERALHEQRGTGERLGEILIRFGLLSPAEIDRGLVMQFKWILRELALLGPSERAGTSPAWDGDREPKRFWPAPWLLSVGKRQHDRLRRAGWAEAWGGRPWCSRPAPAVHVQGSDLSLGERGTVKAFADPRGRPFGDPPATDELVLALAGLLEPVRGRGALLPGWLGKSARDAFGLLGLHWTALDDEIAEALRGRRRELQQLVETGADVDAAALGRKLDEAEATLGNPAGLQAAVRAAASRGHREVALPLLVDNAIQELTARGDLQAADRLAERIERTGWDLPAVEAAAHYVRWRAARERGDRAAAAPFRNDLEAMLQQKNVPAEVHLYGAYLHGDLGDERSARILAKRALAENPYLKEAKRLLE